MSLGKLFNIYAGHAFNDWNDYNIVYAELDDDGTIHRKKNQAECDSMFFFVEDKTNDHKFVVASIHICDVGVHGDVYFFHEAAKDAYEFPTKDELQAMVKKWVAHQKELQKLLPE